MEVDVHPSRALTQPLQQQPRLLAVQLTEVKRRKTLDLGKWLAGRAAPEGQFPVVIGVRRVDDDHLQSAVVSHEHLT